MGSVLGTLAGTEDSTNEDLQWKRSALKKFHKVCGCLFACWWDTLACYNRFVDRSDRIVFGCSARLDPRLLGLHWMNQVGLRGEIGSPYSVSLSHGAFGDFLEAYYRGAAVHSIQGVKKFHRAVPQSARGGLDDGVGCDVLFNGMPTCTYNSCRAVIIRNT